MKGSCPLTSTATSDSLVAPPRGRQPLASGHGGEMPQLDANASSNGSGNRDPGCALVTGAGRGMGAAIAENLAGAGWPVAVNYNESADAAAEVAQRIEADGGRAITVQADVSDF